MAAWNCDRRGDRRPDRRAIALSEFTHFVRDLPCRNYRLASSKAVGPVSWNSFRGPDCRAFSASVRGNHAQRSRPTGPATRISGGFRWNAVFNLDCHVPRNCCQNRLLLVVLVRFDHGHCAVAAPIFVRSHQRWQ